MPKTPQKYIKFSYVKKDDTGNIDSIQANY